MNIVYTLNNKFVPQVAAGLMSVMQNNKEAKVIHFYLIHTDITKSNISKLKKMVESFGRSVDFIKIDDLNSYIDFEFDTNGWNSIVLARLLIDKLLPSNIDRVLYLDGDTIVRGSLNELWNTKMDDKTLGMSIEPTIPKDRLKYLKLGNRPYYNAGVLLINLKRWKKIGASKMIFDFYKKYNGNLFANDQDAINGALKKEILTISPTYNYYNIFYQYNYNFFVRLLKPIKYIVKDVYQDAVNNPTIIHYLGEERPWRKGNTHKYRKDYKYYLSLTPWKDTPDEEGWNLYFFCWRIFNFFTKPFPGLRLRIINGLIPFVMKLRKRKINK